MADEKQAIKELERYAKGIARKLLAQKGLSNDEHRLEDVAQSLLLAGWQVWRDEKNLDHARHRMSTRAANEAEKLDQELRQPPPESSVMPEGGDEDDDVRPTEEIVDRRDDPAEAAAVRDFVDGLPERLQPIFRCRLAGMSNPEIAAELNIGLRTVERAVAELKQEFEKKGFRDE